MDMREGGRLAALLRVLGRQARRHKWRKDDALIFTMGEGRST
jgi:hypothetical protein